MENTDNAPRKHILHKSFVRDMLSFDAMLTPKIILLVYWIGLVGFLIGGITAITQQGLLAALGVWIGGGIIWRMWCEILIVFFKVNENLQRLADNSAGPDAAQS